MKKNLLALTVVGALSLGAAQAETVLYGSVRFDYSNSKNEIGAPAIIQDNTGQITDVTLTGDNVKRKSNFRDNGSRIGLKGGEDLGNGLQVVYHLEWGFDGMEGLGKSDDGFHNRLAYIGLAGDWGTVALGRLDNPFKVTLVDGSVVDDFNGVGYSSTMNATMRNLLGVDARILDNNLDRVGNAFAYLSPNWNGFSFNAAVIMDEDSGALSYRDGGGKKHVDIWTVNAAYEHETGLYGKLGFIQAEGSNVPVAQKGHSWGAQLGYRTDQFGLSVAYADGKNKIDRLGQVVDNAIDFRNTNYKNKGWDIGGSFSFGDNYASTIRANYGQNNLKTNVNVDIDRTPIIGAGDNWKLKEKTWAIGFEQKLSERTRTWVEYEQRKVSGDVGVLSLSGEGTKKPKNQTLSIGIRHDF